MSLVKKSKKYIKTQIWRLVILVAGKRNYDRMRARISIGYWPNLENPKSFNEKAIVRKLNPDESYKFYADKVRVRDFVEKKIGSEYLNELYFVCKEAREIPWDFLPNELVIKTNHGGGDVGLFIIHDLKSYDKQKMIDQLNKDVTLKFGYMTNESWYMDIEPLIFGEKLMVDANNESPPDYRFHCFGGECKFVQVDYGRLSGIHRVFYDLDWNNLNIKMHYPVLDDVPPPPNLEKMIELAEKLAEDFKYIRIDLYDLGTKIIFGEMTFTPVAGWARFDKQETDFEWGRLIPD